MLTLKELLESDEQELGVTDNKLLDEITDLYREIEEIEKLKLTQEVANKLFDLYTQLKNKYEQLNLYTTEIDEQIKLLESYDIIYESRGKLLEIQKDMDEDERKRKERTFAVRGRNILREAVEKMREKSPDFRKAKEKLNEKASKIKGKMKAGKGQVSFSDSPKVSKYKEKIKGVKGKVSFPDSPNFSEVKRKIKSSVTKFKNRNRKKGVYYALSCIPNEIVIEKCDMIDIGLVEYGHKKLTKESPGEMINCPSDSKMVLTIVTIPFGSGIVDDGNDIVLNENHHILVTDIVSINEIKGELFEYNKEYFNSMANFGSDLTDLDSMITSGMDDGSGIVNELNEQKLKDLKDLKEAMKKNCKKLKKAKETLKENERKHNEENVKKAENRYWDEIKQEEEQEQIKKTEEAIEKLKQAEEELEKLKQKEAELEELKQAEAYLKAEEKAENRYWVELEQLRKEEDNLKAEERYWVELEQLRKEEANLKVRQTEEQVNIYYALSCIPNELEIKECDIIDIGLASSGRKVLTEEPQRTPKCPDDYRMVKTTINIPSGSGIKNKSTIVLNKNHYIIVNEVTNHDEIKGELFEYSNEYNEYNEYDKNQEVHFGSRGGKYTIKNGRKRYIK